MFFILALADNEAPQAAEGIYQHLFGEAIRHEAPDRASIWTDTNVYNELGIPAIKIGPRGRRIGPRAEEIEIDICSRPRPAKG